MISNILKKLFIEFKKKDIKYIILRGYIPIHSVEQDKDVDIYISRADRRKAKLIFESLNWKTPKINANIFPHEQYFQLNSNKLYKIDIVWGLYFGDELFHLKNEKKVFDQTKIEDIFSIPRPDTGLALFLLHILFDKESFTKTNYHRYQLLNIEYNSYHIKNDSFMNTKALKEFSNYLSTQDDISKVNENIQYFKKLVLNEGELLENYSLRGVMNLRTRLAVSLRYRLHKYYRNSICIIGVDGSGKSTTVAALKNILDEGANVQYMGFKNFETNLARKYYLNQNRPNYYYKIMPFITIYYEMWLRFLKYRFNNVGITVYDRYVWEAFDNGFGKYKIIYTLLFRFFFPKPKKVYYLHCSPDTSFKRKDDIKDRKEFILMKKRFDKAYKNKKQILSFNTDELEVDNIVEEICIDLNKKMYEFMF